MNVTELQECQAVLGDEDFLISGCHVASVLTYFTQFPRRIANEPIAVSNVSRGNRTSNITRYRPVFLFRPTIEQRSTFEISLVVFSPNRKFARTFRLDKVVYAAPRERRERLSYLRIVPILDEDPQLIFLVNSFLLIPV